jgi:hypothetical protein
MFVHNLTYASHARQAAPFREGSTSSPPGRAPRSSHRHIPTIHIHGLQPRCRTAGAPGGEWSTVCLQQIFRQWDQVATRGIQPNLLLVTTIARIRPGWRLALERLYGMKNAVLPMGEGIINKSSDYSILE